MNTHDNKLDVQIDILINSLEKIVEGFIKANSEKFYSDNFKSNVDIIFNILSEFQADQNIKIAESAGGFIDRIDAKAHKIEFDQFRSSPFRSPLIREFEPLVCEASFVKKLVERLGDRDYLSVILGINRRSLNMMLVAVDSQGNFIFDDSRSEGDREDVLNDMKPCPPPNCKDLSEI
ncbi:hypothetical protein [Tellurirhabdus rosea]|uniref:hypothetical protein n=1 Tax=Tellurirhabdus rosea TaxID=2674997 RepID=UPI0022589526|nr:hypothetical protein [Tellurirhabdus rosea]